MQHFYHNIQGWFDFENIYQEMVRNFPDGSHFVELGSWKGKSTAFMCVEIINSGKKIKFDCVDIWNGAGRVGEYDGDESVKNQSLYDEFIKNMEPAEGYYTPVRDWTAKAAQLYQPKSIDFIFIDAGHDYDSVRADVDAWLPKVKSGGIIGGHDFWQEGVNRAVTETFTNVIRNGSSWIYRVP